MIEAPKKVYTIQDTVGKAGAPILGTINDCRNRSSRTPVAAVVIRTLSLRLIRQDDAYASSLWIMGYIIHLLDDSDKTPGACGIRTLDTFPIM